MNSNAREFMRHAIEVFGNDRIDIEGCAQYGSSTRQRYTLLPHDTSMNDFTTISKPIDYIFRYGPHTSSIGNITKKCPIYVKQFIEHWCEFYNFSGTIEHAEVWYELGTLNYPINIIIASQGRRVRVADRSKRCTVKACYYVWE